MYFEFGKLNNSKNNFINTLNKVKRTIFVFCNIEKQFMPFNKLIEPLKDTLKNKGFDEPLQLQKQILSKIKSGASLFVVAPNDSGKTTSIIISVIQKLKNAFEDAPRALIFVKDKQAALDLELEFNAF